MPMKITFKKLHIVKRAEKHTVVVIVDEVPMLTWKRDGKDDDFQPLDGKKDEMMRLLRADGAIAFLSRLRLTLKYDIALREMRKAMTKHAVFLRDGKIDKIELHNRESMADVRSYLKKHAPKAIILNDQSEEEALALWIKHKK